MFWYLLYPLRGTAQPPRLSANHPIRRAFYRHGKTTAQHWLVAMLVTVAIAMAFSYPTVFLSANPTAGIAAFPHHVWTTAKPYDGNPDLADVEMRQVWVHGSYMKALEKDVLQSALKIQQTLVDSERSTAVLPAFSDKIRSSKLTWGYHSPLMYWNSSQRIIDNDDDILRTINDQARSTSSSLNVALRPASVFAGKQFDHKRLMAADALVLTLMNRVEDGVGNHWQNKMTSLTTDACKDCTLFPRDGRITRSRIYEFSFTPLSLRENIALTIAYSCMALYVLLSLRRLKAFHSRFGLVVTAITQMTCSILASFTICGILKINQSMIPQNAYPFVVLVIGLENMFRIINAVLAYPPTMATELRIANALGDVGPVSVATAIQNFTILALLSRVVSPGVAAFCVFACIATLFDVFFLLTFFVAVLNVDIRRFELQDALARANQSGHRRKPSPSHHHTWFDALVHGRLPFSTRMAGTAVTTTFILSLNYHFFEHKERATSLRHLLRLIKDGPPQLGDFDTFTPPPMNASLTPGQWMRMQDFDTTKEVMRLAKPGADSFIVRVFAPLIVVLSGADRTDMSMEEAWTTALRGFAVHHFYPVAVAVVFAVAFVAVLMNFLLYTEHEDEPRADPDATNDQRLKVQTVSLPHKLDIVKLSGNENGHFVSIALDRTIAIAKFDKTHQTHRTMRVPSEQLASMKWPIHEVTIDDTGEWAAFHCADDHILLYNCASGILADEFSRYPDDNPPLLFDFVRLPSQKTSTLYFVILTSGGRLAQIDVDAQKSKTMRLIDTPLLGASMQDLRGHGRRLVVATDEANVICYAWNAGEFVQACTRLLPVPTLHGRITGVVRFEQRSELGTDFLIISTSRNAIFLEYHTLAFMNRMDAGERAPSFSRVMLGPSTACPACGQLSFRCAALVGDASNEHECSVISLWAAGGVDSVLCLKSTTSSCRSFDTAERSRHSLSRPGAWSAVREQAILGLRQLVAQSNKTMPPHQAVSDSRVRHRRHARTKIRQGEDSDLWEAYKLSLDGETDFVEVAQHADAVDDEAAALYVSNAGPTVCLDGQSVAIAFGNTVKVIKSTRRGSMARRPTGRSLERQSFKP